MSAKKPWELRVYTTDGKVHTYNHASLTTALKAVATLLPLGINHATATDERSRESVTVGWTRRRTTK
jgi:hypothetical protein